MTNGRRGKPANDTKIREAIKNAHDIHEVYDILERGRFNLTSAEERRIARDWYNAQMILKEHGKGAYSSSPVQVVV